MKKVLLSAVAAIGMQAAMAQSSAVTNAIMYQRNGVLDKARVEIDKATQHSKTGVDPKTWYYRGLIYEQHLANPIYAKQVENPARIAYDSFNKAIELDKKNRYTKESEQHKKALYGVALNAGVNHYNEKEYEKALEAYKLAQEINPTDTTAVIYAAYAADANEDYATSKQYYQKAISMNHGTLPIYNRLIYITSDIEKNEDEALKLLAEARKKFPNNKDLMLEELSLFMKRGKGDEAIQKLQEAIALDPTNSNLYAVLGTMYDKAGNTEEAVKNYKKAVEVEPDNFDAQYNMGVYYFNKGAEINNRVSKMDYATYQKQGKKLDAEAVKLFEQALPYFEKAHELQPKDLGTLDSLQKIYVKLNRMKDAERIMNEVDALKK